MGFESFPTLEKKPEVPKPEPGAVVERPQETVEKQLETAEQLREIEKANEWAKYIDKFAGGEFSENRKPEDMERAARERIIALRQRLEDAINNFQYKHETQMLGEKREDWREYMLVNPGLTEDELKIIAFERGVPPPKMNPDGSFRMLLGYGDIGGGHYDYYLEQRLDDRGAPEFWQEITREEVITQAGRRPSEDPYWTERQTIHQPNPDIGKEARQAPIAERTDEGWLREKADREKNRAEI